jgi:hypothetical protein
MRALMRQCRFIKPVLLRSAPDPVSNRPRDLGEFRYGHSNQAAMEKADQETPASMATTISSHSAPLRCGKADSDRAAREDDCRIRKDQSRLLTATPVCSRRNRLPLGGGFFILRLRKCAFVLLFPIGDD